jgi:predicted nucleic acid-binding protein
MIGIDTNVLVRYLVRDDRAQFERLGHGDKRHQGRGAHSAAHERADAGGALVGAVW